MRKIWFYSLIFVLVFAFVFRTLIFNLSTHLLDWLDYPYIVWIMYQNVEKIKNLSLFNFFDTSTFYPHKGTLFFSDLLIPQSLIALPFSYMTSNPILVFNMVFFTTFFLNFLSSFLFWRVVFKKEWIAFIGALFTVFSPFTHLMLGHFQMLSFWPFFFALHFLYKSEKSQGARNAMLVGVFLSLQFLASVYLSVFLIFSIFIYYVSRLISRRNLKAVVKGMVLICTVFLLLSGIFIKGYLDNKRVYEIKRDLGQYITYSAHMSDYLFTSHIHSLVHDSSLIKKWNFFDNHRVGENASFPGFLLLFLGGASMFAFIRKRKRYLLQLQLKDEDLFFFFLIFAGLAFSLGPRLNFNGSYAHIPFAYSFLYKLPFFEVTRAMARWSFLFYFGLTYFALLWVKKNASYPKKHIYLSLILVVLFITEYIPISIKTHKENYIDAGHVVLKEVCEKEKKVVLELPVIHLAAGTSIIEGLGYITKMELASTYHGCSLVNGYSGFDPPSLSKTQQDVTSILKTGNSQLLQLYMQSNSIDVIKFNPSLMNPLDRGSYQHMQKDLQANPSFVKLNSSLYLRKKS